MKVLHSWVKIWPPPTKEELQEDIRELQRRLRMIEKSQRRKPSKLHFRAEGKA